MLFSERVKKLKRFDVLIGKIWNQDNTPTPTPTAPPTPTPTTTNTPTPTEWTSIVNCLSGGAVQELYGSSVALNFSGNRLIAGAPIGINPSLNGYVKIYEKDSFGDWNALGQTIEDVINLTGFGYSVDINALGDIIVIGAPGVLDSGNKAGFAKVYLYDSGSNSWNQIGQTIQGLNVGDRFGISVSINGAGDIIAIGANTNEEFAAGGGQVRTYFYNSTNNEWELMGLPINGTASGDGLGGSVSLNFNGDRLAVGLPTSSSFSVNAGQTKIFQFNGNMWIQLGNNIDFDVDVLAGDFGGWSVSLNGAGDRVAIGYPFADRPFAVGSNSGQVRVYELQTPTSTWQLMGSAISASGVNHNSGYSVNLNFAGDILILGAPLDAASSGTQIGTVKLYQYLGGSWYNVSASFAGIILYGNQRFGHSVTINAAGDQIAVGAPNASVGGVNKNGTVCLSERIVKYELPTPTPSSTPTPTGTPLPLCSDQQFFENFRDSGYSIYRTCYYPITAVFTKLPQPLDYTSDIGKTVVECMSALDFWSKALEGTNFLPADTGDTLYTGTKWITNPLEGQQNKGLLITVDLFNDPTTGVMGYAGITYNRRWVPAYGTNSFNTPYESFFALNLAYINSVSLQKNHKNRSQTFYVILHELGHALGLGSSWHNSYIDPSSGSRKLYNSFIVGAGDNTTNPLGLGLSANFFYALNGYGLRLDTEVGSPTTISSTARYIGDANYKFAFNGYGVNTISKAVSAYNETFGLSVTAIPVENGRGFGSIGSHWDEGHSLDPSYGTDNRAYYGNKYPGAPGLHDELMTPESEAPKIDAPVSKISLGALEDLGYTVNYDMADKFEPLNHTIKYNGDTLTPLCIDFNNVYNGAFCSLGRTLSHPSGKEIKLRKGLTYTFSISSDFGDPIKLTSDEAGTTLIPLGVTNNNVGTGNITYAIPTTLATPMTAWAFASNPNAKAMLLIL